MVTREMTNLATAAVNLANRLKSRMAGEDLDKIHRSWDQLKKAGTQFTPELLKAVDVAKPEGRLLKIAGEAATMKSYEELHGLATDLEQAAGAVLALPEDTVAAVEG